jgi:23S rRNA pseudouridine2604 synthase
MCTALGHRVLQLARVRIMHIKLGDLPSGQWRHLTPKERDEILRTVGLHDKEHVEAAS